MEVKKYATVIKKDHELGGNDYVVGRISGILYVVCGGEEEPHTEIETGRVLIANCTWEAYDRFKTIVKNLYPGLCKFTEQY